jgi:spermidine synthase
VSAILDAARGPRSAVAREGAALVLMAASGFAGLGYQIVWTRQSALWLGHESAAVLAVVAAFFGGLALGAFALGARIERSNRPLRWYAVLEAVVAGWGLVLALLMAPATQALLGLTGEQPSAARQWSVAFAGTFMLLLPATAAMGATLPAMERALADLRGRGLSIASLYAANTAGAVFGVLGASFWLVPEFGLVRTALLCVALNLLCAALASTWLPRHAPGLPPGTPVRGLAPGGRLAVTGLLGIGYEVLVVRVLSQVAENTVYTLAMLLAIYLVGTALGAAAYRRRAARAPVDPDRSRDALIAWLALACLVSTAALWGAEHVKAAVLDGLGAGMPQALTAEALMALAAFAWPTFVMGALFSHLAAQAQSAGMGLGRALGFNTIGAALAPWLFGVVLLPALGSKFALLVVAAGYLALLSPRAWRATPAWAAAVGLAGTAIVAPPLAFIEVPAGGHVVFYREGAMGAASVVEDAGGVARLRIDNRQQEGASNTRFADRRQALLPLLLHPAPRRALFLGLGTGVTASAAADDPMLRVDVVELMPEVVDASGWFVAAPQERRPDPRLHIRVADARRYVRATAQRYELIVADNFHPARSGSGSLYTVEHFAAVRDRLTGDGLFCQWLPLHQLDLDTLRSIVRSFVAVYPQGFAMLATNSLETPVIGLVARADGGRLDWHAAERRRVHASSVLALDEARLGDVWALFGSFIAGPAALDRFAQGAALNTDDRPVVAYLAPRATYAPLVSPGERLVALLRSVSITPGELVGDAVDVHRASRLAAYWMARDRFVAAGLGVEPTQDARRMLEQVREPLLGVLRASPDFDGAYDPLLRMARAVAATEPAAARALLEELVRWHAGRPEAAHALREMASMAR